jgi:hypothetical protein
VTEDPDLPNNLLMTDEAHFHLHETINKQNLRYCPAANPYELHQRPFMTQNLQFGVLFGSEELLDPNSLRMKTNKPSQLHRNVAQMINGFLTRKLPPNHNLWFQQGGAMVHMPVTGMAAICRLLPQWVISPFGDAPWPPPSTDLTSHDFFCRGI